MVWTHDATTERLAEELRWESSVDAIRANGICSAPPECVYCTGALRELDEQRNAWEDKSYYASDCDDDEVEPSEPRIRRVTRHAVRRQLLACTQCGWWAIWETREVDDAEDTAEEYFLCNSVLKNLDVTDVEVETEELCRYLVARYDQRKTVNPRLFEEVVASVFKDRFDVRATAYSGDNGLDLVVLDSVDGETIGVQVKRWKRRIEAEQIRSFAGALLLAGITKGIFVTTGGYREGAHAAVKEYKQRGYRVELWDAQKFYERLGVAWQPTLESCLLSSPMDKWRSLPVYRVGSAITYCAY